MFETTAMKWDELRNEQCAVARSLAVVGDRWTLLILTDCFFGVRKFETFMQRLEISRTVLGERLLTLVEQGVLSKVAYQQRPVRYEYHLTVKGMNLYPVIATLADWGNQYYLDKGGPPVKLTHNKCEKPFRASLHCQECGEAVTAFDVHAEIRPDCASLPPVRRGPVIDT